MDEVTAAASKARLDDFHQGFCLERCLEGGSKSEVRILPKACRNEDLWVWDPLAPRYVGAAESAASTEVPRALTRPTSEQPDRVSLSTERTAQRGSTSAH